MSDPAGMNRSLERLLVRQLAAVTLLLGVVAGAVSFALAYKEAREYQDDMLRQVGRLSSITPATLTLSADAAPAPLSDPESRLTIVRLPQDPTPVWAAGIADGLSTVATPDGRLRVYSRTTGKQTVLVAQSTDARDEAALGSALRTLLPVLVLLPLLVFGLARLLRHALAPVARAAAELDAQAADRPEPVDATLLPTEILPFVAAINRLLDRVGTLIGQQRRFIGDASHELRSPLAALSVQAENLAHATTLDEARERLAPLSAGIERARALTEQLLDLARTQTGNETPVALDAHEVALALLEDFDPLAVDRGIDLGLDSAGPAPLTAPPQALRLLLANALDNALKYTPRGGQVTLAVVQQNHSVRFEVRDTGPGIPAGERERVFEAFHRGPGAPGVGSGLGLAIAREAASRLGATLELDDAPEGTGLVVRVTLPCVRGGAAAG